MFKLLTIIFIVGVVAGVRFLNPNIGLVDGLRQRWDEVTRVDIPRSDYSLRTDYEDKINSLSRGADSLGAPRPKRSVALQQEAKQKRVRVLVDLNNQELIDISRDCAKVSALRSSLMSVMVTWDMAWPTFKETWDRCIDHVVSDYPQAVRLKKMRKSDFDVQIDYLGRGH